MVNTLVVVVMLFATLFIKELHAAPSPYQWQQSIQGTPFQEDWQKYVRSPPTKTVRPAEVLSQYTVGNVTNPNGLLTGKGATILTRTQSSQTPTIVVDWGMNIAGFLSINFGGSYNTSIGLPGIRLAFSETLQYLTDRSDFSRSDNVGKSIH